MDGRGAVVWEKQKGPAPCHHPDRGLGVALASILSDVRRVVSVKRSLFSRDLVFREFPSEHDSRRVLRQGATRTDFRAKQDRTVTACPELQGPTSVSESLTKSCNDHHSLGIVRAILCFP